MQRLSHSFSVPARTFLTSRTLVARIRQTQAQPQRVVLKKEPHRLAPPPPPYTLLMRDVAAAPRSSPAPVSGMAALLLFLAASSMTIRPASGHGYVNSPRSRNIVAPPRRRRLYLQPNPKHAHEGLRPHVHQPRRPLRGQPLHPLQLHPQHQLQLPTELLRGVHAGEHPGHVRRELHHRARGSLYGPPLRPHHLQGLSACGARPSSPRRPASMPTRSPWWRTCRVASPSIPTIPKGRTSPPRMAWKRVARPLAR